MDPTLNLDVIFPLFWEAQMATPVILISLVSAVAILGAVLLCSTIFGEEMRFDWPQSRRPSRNQSEAEALEALSKSLGSHDCEAMPQVFYLKLLRDSVTARDQADALIIDPLVPQHSARKVHEAADAFIEQCHRLELDAPRSDKATLAIGLLSIKTSLSRYLRADLRLRREASTSLPAWEVDRQELALVERADTFRERQGQMDSGA